MENNQLIAMGGLQKVADQLRRLPVNGTLELINYAFCAADIEEAIRLQVPEQEYAVGARGICGVNTVRVITRIQ